MSKGTLLVILLLLVFYATSDKWEGILHNIKADMGAIKIPGTLAISSSDLHPNAHATNLTAEAMQRETKLLATFKKGGNVSLKDIETLSSMYEQLIEYRPMDERLLKKSVHYHSLVRMVHDQENKDRSAFGSPPSRLTPKLPYDAVNDYLETKMKGTGADLLFEQCSSLHSLANLGWFVNCRWKTVDKGREASLLYHDWFLIRQGEVLGVEPFNNPRGSARYRDGRLGNRVVLVQ